MLKSWGETEIVHLNFFNFICFCSLLVSLHFVLGTEQFIYSNLITVTTLPKDVY